MINCSLTAIMTLSQGIGAGSEHVFVAMLCVTSLDFAQRCPQRAFWQVISALKTKVLMMIGCPDRVVCDGGK